MATGYGGTYRGSVVDTADPLSQSRLRRGLPLSLIAPLTVGLAGLACRPRRPLLAPRVPLVVRHQRADSQLRVRHTSPLLLRFDGAENRWRRREDDHLVSDEAPNGVGRSLSAPSPPRFTHGRLSHRSQGSLRSTSPA